MNDHQVPHEVLQGLKIKANKWDELRGRLSVYIDYDWYTLEAEDFKSIAEITVKAYGKIPETK